MLNPSHYVSLPLAKRVKEAGFSQISDFYWKINWKETLKGWQDENGDLWDAQEVLRGPHKYQSYFQLPEVDQKKYPPKYILCINQIGGIPKEPFGADCYAAYSVAELGDILPASVKTDEMTFDLSIWKSRHFWYVGYWWDEDSRRKSGFEIATQQSEKLADAMALAALNLRERGII